MGHWSYHDKDALSHRCKHLRRQYNEMVSDGDAMQISTVKTPI